MQPYRHKPKKLNIIWYIVLPLLLSLGFYPHKIMAKENQYDAPSAGFDLSFSKGIFYINQKKYQEAVSALNQALAQRPDDLEASYYLGVALIKIGKEKEAEEILKNVLKVDQMFEKAHFDLGVAEYNLGKYQEALKELELAEAAESDRALIYYYQGLTLHQLKEYERSSPRFLRAVALAPELGLTSHFYAGAGFYRRGFLEEARDEFQETQRIDPTSEVARAAQEFLDQIDASGKKTKRWDLIFSPAYQYDTNVILLPGLSALPEGISRKGDSRLVIYARAGLKIFEAASLSADGGYSFYQSLHNELTSFNVQNHEGIASILYKEQWLQVRVPYAFGHALVDEHTFLQIHSIKPLLTISESSITSTQLQYIYSSKDFVNTNQSPNNDDRDGINHLAGVTQTFVFTKSGQFQIGYSYDVERTGNSSAQDDWAYHGQKVSGNLRLSTLMGMKLDLASDYYVQRYQRPNTFSQSGDKRTDHIQNYVIGLSKGISRQISLTVQYMFNRNDSDIPVFTYDRNIYSLIVTGGF